MIMTTTMSLSLSENGLHLLLLLGLLHLVGLHLGLLRPLPLLSLPLLHPLLLRVHLGKVRVHGQVQITPGRCFCLLFSSWKPGGQEEVVNPAKEILGGESKSKWPEWCFKKDS